MRVYFCDNKVSQLNHWDLRRNKNQKSKKNHAFRRNCEIFEAFTLQVVIFSFNKRSKNKISWVLRKFSKFLHFKYFYSINKTSNYNKIISCWYPQKISWCKTSKFKIARTPENISEEKLLQYSSLLIVSCT